MAKSGSQRVKESRQRKRARKEKNETDATAEVWDILRKYSTEIYAHIDRKADGSLSIIWRFPLEAENELAAMSEHYLDLGLPTIVDTMNGVIIEAMNARNGTPLWEAEWPGTGSHRMSKSEVIEEIERA